MDNPEPHTQATFEIQNYRPGDSFRHVRDLMLLQPDPMTDDEIEALARQEPLPPNHAFQLPAEEQPTNHENQLHLQ